MTVAEAQMEFFNDFARFIPLLIPILLIQIGLMVFALMDILKKRKARGNFWVWVFVIILVNIFGPIAYFTFGRVDE
jgi:hypothetical protein